MADPLIHEIPTTATSFASDDYIVLDGVANGTRNMTQANLKNSVVAGNLAPLFDPTTTSSNAYAIGDDVIYDGEWYSFTASHYGAWNASHVTRNGSYSDYVNHLASASSLASTDVITVTNPTDGTRKMSKDDLMTETAQATLAGNLAPAFDPTRTSENQYLAGDIVMHDGKLYVFKVDHYGNWNDSNVYRISTFEATIKLTASANKLVNHGLTSSYIGTDGSLVKSPSWTTYKFKVQKGYVYYRCRNTTVNSFAVAFYNADTPTVESFISGVPLALNGWTHGIAVIPTGTKLILVSSRTADGATSNDVAVYEDLAECYDQIKEALTLDDATEIDHKYYNGSEFITSNSWTRYVFDCFGNYSKIKVKAQSNHVEYGEAIFLNAERGVISYVSFGINDSPVEQNIAVPEGCRYICVCNRTASLETPEFLAFSPTMHDAFLPVINSKLIDVYNAISTVENKFAYQNIESALYSDSYYFYDGNFGYSTSWTRYVFDSRNTSKIRVKAATHNGNYAELVFCSNENLDVISSVPFGNTGIIEKEVSVPDGCKYICLCNRTSSLETPEFSGYAKNLVEVNKDINDLYEKYDSIASTSTGIAGVVKVKAAANAPIYATRIGDIESVASHFKMALVKDGIVQYYLNGTDILHDENGLFDSILDGTDGDVLIVNDIPIYYLTGCVNNIVVRLFSLAPFVFHGVAARKVEPRGDAPSLCFVDNINDSDTQSHESNLGNGKTHYVRNSSNVAIYVGMTDMVGKYVPVETGGIISYTYDSSKSFIDSGAYRPSVYLNQNTAERAASNKNLNGSIYTNMDLLSMEILLSLVEAECGTNYINDPSLFGNGFSSPTDASTVVTSDLFENGTSAINGVRFKDSNDAWVYCRLNASPLSNNKAFYVMLTDWTSPWEIMEQHLALSYAKRQSIQPNTWFVFNENEYKYIDVGNLKGIAEGVMTAVLFKKFRSKIGDGIQYNNTDISGNDIEFVLISSVYRGWILDVSPHRWITGLNVTVDDSYHYKFFAELNYKKYIMNTDYAEIDENSLFDFEKHYHLVKEVTGPAYRLYPKYTNEGLIYLPTEYGASLTTYECGVIETDDKKANSGKKICTGAKLGYGPYSDNISRYFIYLNHPRDYTVARAGYSSFVCQNVE